MSTYYLQAFVTGSSLLSDVKGREQERQSYSLYMGLRRIAKTSYLCFLQITSLHTDKQLLSLWKETYDQVCDQCVRCNGPQAEQLYFLEHFITFIKSMHDILVPGYDSRRIKYLTKVAYDNENTIRRWTVQCRESTSTEEVRLNNHRYSHDLQSLFQSFLSCCFVLLLSNRDDSMYLTRVFLLHLIF